MAFQRENTGFKESILKYADIGIAIILMLIIVMMIIPIPPFLIDILLALNITVSVIVLLSTFYVLKALELAAFPTILLFTTLFRLALNVSTTRLILLNGYAGEIILAFGNFVVGGNYIVGFIIFLILVIIQFVVITRGAERVAEVAARFTLDAMPGKQMAIDADLNSGMLDDNQARERRKEIQREADFYGAMDGASKFVKGDAVAGLIITAVNILGGIGIGILMRDMDVLQALGAYALLTVGDGLVGQIPALMLSTATGVLVTRAAGESNLGRDLVSQLTGYPKPLMMASGLLILFALIPGLPFIPFMSLGSIVGLMGYYVFREGMEATEKLHPGAKPPKGGEGGKGAVGGPSQEGTEQPKGPENVLPLLQVDPMEIEIGYALIPLVDPEQGGDMLERITMIRRQMATDMGLIVPPIRIRDNIQIKPNEYIIRIKGASVGKGELLIDHYLAMNPGTVEEEIIGIPTIEPAFGLRAIWIPPEMRERAESIGYTVVDTPSVLATHLGELIKRMGYELLSRQEVQRLVDMVKESNPAVIDELVPNVLSIGEIQKVFQNLLKEQVPIRDLVTVFETMADYGRMTRNVDTLTERVREALSRHLTNRNLGQDGKLYVITVSPQWEEKIKNSVREGGGVLSINLSPADVRQFTAKVAQAAENAAAHGYPPILLSHPDVRFFIRKIIEGSLPHVVVLSYNEIAPGTEVQAVGMVE